MLMKSTLLIGGVALALSANAAMQHAGAQSAPKFTVDPASPRIPNNWQLGQVASVSVDANDHVWIPQRPS